MKKKYFIFAASALALASCSSDDYLGDNPGGDGNAKGGAIAFQGETGATTRASHGNAAAKLLGNKFYVLGTKGTLPEGNPTETIVFDNYQVNYEANTAGKTDDNSSDWKYVGVEPTGLYAGTSAPTVQTIKYWDYSVPQYDFIAYSVGDNTLLTTTGDAVNGSVVGSAIKTPKAANYVSYTLKGATTADLTECYYTDVTEVKKDKYKEPVQFEFKNLTAKVRVAFYETVPGYSVSDIQFYEDNTTTRGALTDKEEATLFTTNDASKLPGENGGTITVTYPSVGANNSSKADYNKAFVSVAPTDETTTIKLGKVNYLPTSNTIGTTAKEASLAGKADDHYYTPVLPTVGHPLTLRINYTLTSIDGSGEQIKVYGAKAVVPAAYTAWQPNYAYTYIFKISDNTNGYTSTDNDTEGLYPITFDAVVADIDEADFNHESITTVATPSVTSYAFNNATNKVINAYDVDGEYPAATTTDIYVSVEDKTDLNTNGQLYTVDKAKATEAEVIDALQVRVSGEDGNEMVGRNGIKLSPATTTLVTTIPTEDGKGITASANSVAKFTATTTATTYAYVYKVQNGTAVTEIKTAFPGDGTTVATDKEYYTDYECTDANAVGAGEILAAGTVYYKKYTNNNNVYGVKVIRTK